MPQAHRETLRQLRGIRSLHQVAQQQELAAGGQVIISWQLPISATACTSVRPSCSEIQHESQRPTRQASIQAQNSQKVDSNYDDAVLRRVA